MVRLPSLFRQLFDPDEGAIATMAMVVSRGGVLYRDVIDRKPPGAPLLYSLSFWVTGARDLRPVHLIAALELAACALILMSEARRSGTARAGWWAAGLFLAGAVAFMPSDAQPANFSQLALLPGVRSNRRGAAKLGAERGVGRSVPRHRGTDAPELAHRRRPRGVRGVVARRQTCLAGGDRSSVQPRQPSARSRSSCRSARSSSGRSRRTGRCSPT